MTPNDEHPGTLIPGPRIALCLDFANTLAGRGSIRSEALHSFADLVNWCRAGDIITQTEAEALLDWSLSNPTAAAASFTDAMALREAIYGIFARIASDGEAHAVDEDRLNRAMQEAPARMALAHAGTGFVWRVACDRTTAANLLAAVLWSAGDLLTSKQLGRVRLCANHQCLWLFYDDSLRGARRWCSMQACGNRAKTQRHYLRRKAQ